MYVPISIKSLQSAAILQSQLSRIAQLKVVSGLRKGKRKKKDRYYT